MLGVQTPAQSIGDERSEVINVEQNDKILPSRSRVCPRSCCVALGYKGSLEAQIPQIWEHASHSMTSLSLRYPEALESMGAHG